VDWSRRQFLASVLGLSYTGGWYAGPFESLLGLLSQLDSKIFPQGYERLSVDDLLDGSAGKSLDSSDDSQTLFLTFDDGPQPCTSKILDALALTRHRVTFFVLGRNLANPPLRDIAVRALQEGHDIGNHSFEHPHFATISSQRAEREITATHELILDVYAEAGIDPTKRKLFSRFPYGGDASG